MEMSTPFLKKLKFISIRTVNEKRFSPKEGKIALSANEQITEFLHFAIQLN